MSPGRAAAAVASSSCLYLAGMALNDWADREVDAIERPGRPIPSGRVSPRFALGLAGGLTVAGLATASMAGREALRVAAPLAATVWCYDLLGKQTVAGPAAMAAARTLDVLLGAGGRGAGALPAAALVGAHTGLITTVSRSETTGATPALAGAALLGHAAIGAGAGILGLRRGPSLWRKGASLALAGAYIAATAKTALAARAEPTPANLQRHVAAGIHGFLPLDAALLASCGPRSAAAAIAALWPVARRLSRKRSPT